MHYIILRHIHYNTMHWSDSKYVTVLVGRCAQFGTLIRKENMEVMGWECVGEISFKEWR